MARLLSRIPLLFVLLQWLPVLAAEEAPTEKASPLVVITFLVLLVGACAGYGVYLMMSNKGKPEKDD